MISLLIKAFSSSNNDKERVLAFSILALMFDKSRTFSLVTLNSFLAFSIACFTSLAKVELYTLIFICLEILGLAIEVIVRVVSPLFLPVTFNPSIVQYCHC